MNYLEQINQFWAKDAEYRFSDRETALYFHLLRACDSAHWRNPLRLSNGMIMARFGWGKASFDRARGRLREAGLIDFRAGVGRGNTCQYVIRAARGGASDEKAAERKADASFEPVPGQGHQKGAQTNIFSERFSENGRDKDIQTDTFSEKRREKCTQTNTFSEQFSEKDHEKGAQINAFSEKCREKGTQADTFSGQFSEKGREKGAQTDTFSECLNASIPPKNNAFQRIVSHKPAHNPFNIIYRDKIYNEKKKEKGKNENGCAQNEVVELYRAVCRSFPQIMQLTLRRKEKIARRLAEMNGMATLEKVFRKMEASDFLKGKNKIGWKANIFSERKCGKA